MSHVRRLAILAGLLAALPAAAAAQSYPTDRGSLLLGGGAGFSSSGTTVDGEEQGDRITSFNLSPSVQYFVVPGLALGGDLSVSRFSDGEQSITTYGGGPSASYYFGSGERPFYPFVSANVRLVRNSENDDSNLGYGASTGAVFMFNRSVGLRTSLYYNVQSLDAEEIEIDNDTFGVGIGFTAFTF